jgi:hypothetical protein
MRFQRLGAATVVAAVLLTGCAAAAPTEPLTRAAVSPVDNPPPAPVLARPKLSAGARGISPTAAEAFVRYWVEALNFAGQTGRTRALREASYSGCSTCNAVITAIEQVHGAGGYYRDDAGR